MKTSVADKIVEGLKEFTEALENKDVISEKFNCRKIVLDLNHTSYDPNLVKETRCFLGASQAIFARFLGVSINTVQSWEQGANRPSDMACRFMDEIRHDPEHWRERLTEMATVKVAQ